ncbi:hypothetical protein E2562_016245 [Oryza meyeriana var. granulata]|uniref:Uncharacterized protein n=1 Tax=Oryza meyeriana var. granulata TaxID=110450 RepID=A0A6G1CQN4_9ORYZ|nr:hypothetical protein E2562_016245 [Oryza meyeriana var. granulata]
MGACATKPKTLEGKAPEEATPIEAPKVALETTVFIEVVADQAPEKVVEAKVEPAIAEMPTDIIMQNTEATPELNNKDKGVEEGVEEKIVEEEKPSALVAKKNSEVNNTEVVEETIEVKNTEVGKGTIEVKSAEEEKPI